MQVCSEAGLHDEQILKRRGSEKDEAGLQDDARKPERLAFWDQVKEGEGRALIFRVQFLLLIGHDDGATEYFGRACAKDPATLRSLWYALYLWLVKKDLKTALQIINRRITLTPEEDAPRYLGALITYSARDYRQAQAFVSDIEDRHYEENYAQLLEALIALAQGDYVTAEWKFHAVAVAEFSSTPHSATDVEQAARESFIGCSILCLVLQGKVEKARAIFDALQKSERSSPLDMCIAFMAFGDMEASMLWLSNAISDHNIVAIWCSTLPLFDPLQNGKPQNALSDFEKKEVEWFDNELKWEDWTFVE